MKKQSPILLVPKQLQIRKYATPAPTHYHRMWEFSIFESGEYINTIDNQSYRVTAGDVFLIGEPHLHALECTSGPHAYWDIYLPNDEMKKICDLISPDFYDDLYSKKIFVHFKLSNARLQHLLYDLRELSNYELSAQTSNSSTTTNNSILSSFLAHYLLGIYYNGKNKQELSTPEWLQNLLYNLQSPEFFCQKASEIIKLSDYSQPQFSREFKKYTGLTLIDYLMVKRLDYAAELLQKTELSVLQISFEVGYTSLSFFIRLFKKRYNVTPLQYRLNSKTNTNIKK